MSDQSGDDGILTAPKPSFDPEAATDLAERVFGKSGTVSELGGERDQNFRLDTSEGDAFVLKISNPAEDPEALDLQTQALRHIARTDPDLPVMDLVHTVDGEPWAAVDHDGETHLVRLFTLVPGRMPSGPELDHDALYAYGEVAARMGVALRGFFHPGAQYDILWDLKNTPQLRSRLDAVDESHRRDVAERVLDRFDDRVAPVFETLRAQVIHNDLTYANVLFGDDDRVSGVVDFGDLTHTALVCDLAVVLARVMFERADPLEAAQATVRGYVSVTPLEPEEARVLGDLVAARLVAWGTIAAWRAEQHPDNREYITSSADRGWDLLLTLDERGFDRVGRCLRTAARSSNVPYAPMDTADLHARRRDVLGSSPLSYRDPVHFVAGDGVWLLDPAGNRYLDAYNNVQVVGHANPTVAAAIAGQSRTLATNTRYLHEAVVRLGERLTATMPDGLDTVLFVNSGSEATDVAWRLATASTGRSGAVVTDYAYHGITESTIDLSPDVWPDGYHPDHVEPIIPPVDTRHRQGVTAAGLREAVDTLAARDVDFAALMFDTMFTSDGILPPQGDEVRRLVDAAHDAGGLVIADEVQAGFGRSGSHLWGFEVSGIVPDIVTLGKPMGNGHPVAAVVTRSDIAASLMDRTGLFSTFGGNPVSSAAALAVLDVVEERELVDHVGEVGEYLQEGLTHLSERHDLVSDVRAQGLMVGVELARDGETRTPAKSETKAVVNALRQRRVLIGSAGRHGNVLKIRPPLVFERDHADVLLDALDGVLEDVDA